MEDFVPYLFPVGLVALNLLFGFIAGDFSGFFRLLIGAVTTYLLYFIDGIVRVWPFGPIPLIAALIVAYLIGLDLRSRDRQTY